MATQAAALDDLNARWADVHALGVASGVLSWDQETMMPAKGQPGRGAALAALAGITHAQLTDPRLDESISRVEAEAEPGSVAAAQARRARRSVVRATAVPAALTRQLAELSSTALASWQEARAHDDFSRFAPDLGALVDATRQAADALVDAGVAERPYDALLDDYEPASTEADLVTMFDLLRTELVPLVERANDSSTTVDVSPWQVHADDAAQESFVRAVAAAQGYDWEAGRMDPAAHPFTAGFGPGDVRITRRFAPDDLRPGLLGTMHEVGHALYEQGLPADLAGTPAGEVVSLGAHESQSRLWENQVGRSHAFLRWATPLLGEHIPATEGADPDALWRGLHTVTPSLIRVDADEVTYNLHIVARFDLERALFAGELEVADLRDAWDETYQRLLGVRPPDAANGVLQDIHWSMGAFGYFPTYTLGNLIAAQLFEAITAELGDVDALLGAGQLAPILGWLRDRVHRHAGLLDTDELVLSATGRALSAEPLVAHLRRSVESVYGA